MNPGMCILATRARLMHGVPGAVCGTSDAPAPAPAPSAQTRCGYWTGPVWPTGRTPSRDPAYVPDPGCPPAGCLFHLPSDPSERRELGAQFPSKLRELSARLAQLRKGCAHLESRICLFCCSSTPGAKPAEGTGQSVCGCLVPLPPPFCP